MRRIILASKSKARKQILKQIGIKFKTSRSRVKEVCSFKNSCQDLVVTNALIKARDVAQRVSAGVVIAADTVILTGKAVVGKPKNTNDAVRILRLLSRKPHWVYTGIAVIDVNKNKVLTDYEKTKVYMCPLTDRQIRNYLKRSSPFDKAGSFDIQGMGGLFIDKIEGCYYNVVGLPLAKLVKLLQKLKVDVF